MLAGKCVFKQAWSGQVPFNNYVMSLWLNTTLYLRLKKSNALQIIMWNGWQRISVGSQHIKWQGLCISVIPAPEKQKDHKFKVILNYIASFKASMGLLRPMGRKQRLRTSKMVQQVKECLHKPVTCVWSAQTQRKKKNQLMNSVPYPIIINIKKKKKRKYAG